MFGRRFFGRRFFGRRYWGRVAPPPVRPGAARIRMDVFALTEVTADALPAVSVEVDVHRLVQIDCGLDVNQ